ncbi:MAG TPA: class I SAM-dependent methyltransferase, partial [Thermoanaerobaculia bacterium]|nr:class I SAM-dependent methyltransferase [Thermoanaerobaculia bacterium]
PRSAPTPLTPAMSDRPPEPLDVARFAGPEPTRDFAAWRRLWNEDVPFPVASHRGAAGSLLVAFKRLLRPFVKAPLADLWDRQRVFNLILLEHAESHAYRVGRLEEQVQALDERAARLEVFVQEALDEALSHNDALFTRADQKLDRYRRESQDLAAALGAALAGVNAAGAEAPAEPAEERTAPPGPSAAGLGRALDERAYLELERRYRGTEEEIAERLERYLPYFREVPAGRPVLDLGCGRGEALALLAAAGVPARGVDSNERMVARCRERGLAAEAGDLFAALAAAEPESLGGVVSFHVVEHLPPAAVDRLVRLAHRALAPGGVLVLETPNALSVAVSARSFWLDPTHRRPVHPRALALVYELAGFERVEHLELRPFAAAERLPEIDTAALPAEQQALADRVNRLRDRLDDLLYGFQDYALVGRKPGGAEDEAALAAESAVTSGA